VLFAVAIGVEAVDFISIAAALSGDVVEQGPYQDFRIVRL